MWNPKQNGWIFKAHQFAFNSPVAVIPLSKLWSISFPAEFAIPDSFFFSFFLLNTVSKQRFAFDRMLL